MTTPIWQFVLWRPFLSINTFILWYFIAFTANIERHFYCCGGVALARRDFGGILESSFRHCWRCALRDNVYSINTSIWRGKELGIWELYLYILVCGTHCWFNLVRGNNFKAIKLVERHWKIHWGIFGIVLKSEDEYTRISESYSFFCAD